MRPYIETAARDIQASYTPPGAPTRPRKDPDGKTGKRRHPLSLDEEVRQGTDEMVSRAEAIPIMADALGAAMALRSILVRTVDGTLGRSTCIPPHHHRLPSDQEVWQTQTS